MVVHRPLDTLRDNGFAGTHLHNTRMDPKSGFHNENSRLQLDCQVPNCTLPNSNDVAYSHMAHAQGCPLASRLQCRVQPSGTVCSSWSICPRLTLCPGLGATPSCAQGSLSINRSNFNRLDFLFLGLYTTPLWGFGKRSICTPLTNIRCLGEPSWVLPEPPKAEGAHTARSGGTQQVRVCLSSV